jgi:DNA-binding CsgD family transcriptional regulator
MDGRARIIGRVCRRGRGAAYIVSSKRTGGVEWACFSGPSVDLKGDYIEHYAGLDPFTPLLHAGGGRWQALSACLPEELLRRDEWYNDFVLKAGVSDILGATLFDSSSHTVILGMHKETGKAPFAPACVAALQQLLEPLGGAARLHTELRDLAWKSCIARQALDQLAAAVVVTDKDRRVVEINDAAERIMQRGEALTIRAGRLVAPDESGDARIGALIAAAAGTGAVSGGHMYIARRGLRPGYTVTVAPLRPDLAFHDAPLAMILIADPEARALTPRDLAELFGLSPAESRLAAALAAGKTLRESASAFGIQITTARTQLAAILKKVGVSRQSDLLRAFSADGVSPSLQLAWVIALGDGKRGRSCPWG